MKLISKNIIYVIGPLIIIATLSCSTGKDIYRNPYQSTSRNSPIASYESLDQQQPDQKQAPEWIYAVSRDFVVGYGQGRNIMEAKSAALNDIKAFIIKSLGETGSIIEINFVQNNVEGRNIIDSQEAYLLKNHFENKYTPVINISVDRFDDYYFEETGNSAKYYIKYNIDATELARIKNDFNLSLQKNVFLKARTHQVVDSLVRFPENPVLESEIERYDAISDFLVTANPDRRDSLLLLRGLQDISVFLNTIEIKVVEHDPGKLIRFGLFNSQVKVWSKLEPGIKSAGIKIDTLIKKDGIWELRYNTQENLNSTGSLEITFDLPASILTSKITVPKPVLKPVFEIVDKIQMSDFQKDAWNGVLKSLTVKMNINYNDKVDCKITSMEILLHSENSINPGITADNLNFILTPGVNSFAKTLKNELPVRFFLSREKECDLMIYFKTGNSLDKFQIRNIPVIINR